jgi:hypothetical protein
MKRPVGFTIIAILLGIVAIAGISSAWGMLSGALGDMPLALGIIALVFGIAAAATAVGLWRLDAWVITALRIWMAAFFIFVVTFVYLSLSMFRDSLPGLAGFLVFLAILFALLDRYVRRKYANAA